MRYVKELSNRNKIISEHTCEALYEQQNDAYTIKFVFNGAEDCEINKRRFCIYPDTFAVVNAGTNFCSKIDSINPVNTLAVSFGENFIKDFHHTFSSSNESLLDGKEVKEAPAFIESLYPFTGDMRFNVLHLKKQLDKGLKDEMLINEYMYHCLLNYYKIYDREVVQKLDRLSFIKTKTREEVLKRLTLAKEYICSNYDQNITLEDIAEQACLSVNHLLRTFKEAYETSPYQFLMQLRLNRAKGLLQTTSYSLNEIVGLVGFECPSSFIRLFKNTFNITPLKYRKSKLN
ncbi:helix-turn-helix transcriptional regulator [Pedobacter sp. UBA5917]|jgi:AraC-like DNA-binding protein|uniref:helix-turn-helix transcriptional regulator n=1 Tax=Pedobacter sp. UBA5917 TaxID=1947061 RepID=UPI0025D29C50|nr:AraC family transcriptional regulator [Pedobacter sp. UBA5917]